MQTHYFMPKVCNDTEYNVNTQIHALVHDSHSSVVSRIIKAFALHSFFVYFSPKFSMFNLLILLDLIIDYFLKSLSISID